MVGKEVGKEYKSLKDILEIDKEDRPKSLIKLDRFILSNLRNITHNSTTSALTFPKIPFEYPYFYF